MQPQPQPDNNPEEATLPQAEPESTQGTQRQAKKSPPLDRAVSGAVELPIWLNQAEDGTEYANPGKIVRFYRDEHGNRQSTEFLRDRDLLDAAYVCQEAHRIISQYRKEQAQARRNEQN